MRILIAAIGKLKDAEERAISERYAKRFTGAGGAIGLGPVEIREFPESRAASVGERKRDEAARLLKATAPPISSLRSIRPDDRSAAKPSPPCWAGSAMTALKPARF